MMPEAATQPALLSFQPDAGAIEVDLDVLITSKMLIQANSGGGKSYVLRYLLEQTYGRVPQIVFDPEGEFASLREHFAYVLAGVDGDVPARPDLAAPLCRRLVELGASAVLDLYELESQERELRERPTVPQVERIEVPVFQNGQRAQLEQIVMTLADVAGQLTGVAQGLGTALERVGSGATSIPPPSGSTPASPGEPSAHQDGHSNPATTGSAQLLEAQQRILDSLLAFEALGLREVARQHLAIWSRQSPRSSAFGNHLGLLRSFSLIDYPQGGYVALTEQGRQLAHPVAPIHSLAELRAA